MNELPEISPEGEKVQEEVKETLPQENPETLKRFLRVVTSRRTKKKRGVGITRADKSSTKKAVKLAKKQRAVNQQRSNKKRRATGSKQRK